MFTVTKHGRQTQLEAERDSQGYLLIRRERIDTETVVDQEA
jgi:hypothetical protein